MKPAIYEGDGAYIFVSYAHKDSEAVFEVLNALQAQGYRFWYDAGIAPGSEWPEDIARHLDAAEAVFAFVTPNSMASHNCRREINFSLSRKKPFLAIYLEETEMSLGMEMQLSAQQSVKKFNYETWDGFINQILKCPDIAHCRKEQKPPQEPEATPGISQSIQNKNEATPDNVQPAHSSVEAAPDNVQPAQNRAKAALDNIQPVQNRVEIASGNVKPVQNRIGTAPTARPATEKKPLKIGKVLGLLVAALVIVAIAVFAFGQNGATKAIPTSWGSEIEIDATSVHADGKTITQSDLDSIASLGNLKSVELANCDFSDCDLSSLTFSSTAMKNLDLSGSTGIADFSFLSNLALQDLRLEGLDNFDDLSSIDTSELTKLNISGTGVESLDALQNAPLQKLAFANTTIGDISPVAKMVDLEVIDGANSQVTSIDAIIDLENLQSLNFNGCKIDYPNSPLAALSLSEAHLANTGLKDLSLFANCTILKALDISRNGGIATIDGLDAKNYSSLESLNVAQTSLEADDLASLSQCSNMKKLILDGCPLHDLKCCKGLGELTYLSAVNCSLDNIDDLAGCTQLESVYLSCNNIEDISALSNLEKAENYSSISNKVVLELTANNLESVASLPAGNYRAIMLYDNAENIATTVPDGVESEQFAVSWCKGLGDGELANQGYSSTIYVVDCPQNEALETKDALMGEQLVSKDELRELYANAGLARKLAFDTEYFLNHANLG